MQFAGINDSEFDSLIVCLKNAQEFATPLMEKNSRAMTGFFL